MGNVYRPVRVDPNTGDRVPSAKWYLRYRDARGALHNVAGFRDKSAALAKLAEIERRVERQLSGLADPCEEEALRPLAEHLAEFEEVLSARGRTQRHVRLTLSRVRRILSACHAAKVMDLRASRVEAFLGEERAAGKSAQTLVHLVRAVKEFSAWLVRDRRVSLDPLASLAAPTSEVESDRRLVRRALSLDEAASLLDAARSSLATFRGLSGKAREALYLTAMRTGLRAAELASLTPDSLDLDADPPTVTIAAGDSKNRRASTLPLHPDAEEVLRVYVAQRDRAVPLWPLTWYEDAAEMLRGDLAAAGIPFEVDGERLDFHALRHCAGTFACQAGVHPRLAQALLRHSDINLTMRRYTHPALLDLAAAVGKMPRLRPAPARTEGTAGATGTDGRPAGKCVPPCVPKSVRAADSDGKPLEPADAGEEGRGEPRTPRKSRAGKGLEAAGNAGNSAKAGAQGGICTHILRFTKPLLHC